MSSESERVAKLLLPISEAEPAGKEARTEPEHERVRAEVAQLAALSGQTVDWPAVTQAGEALLSQKSKDLAIACYLAAALQEVHGLSGLSDGFSLLTGLARAFGSKLFPLRARARANAVEWFVERAARHLDQAPPTERGVIDGLREQVSQLSDALQDLLGSEAPSISPLRYALERMALSAKVEDVPAPMAAAPATTPLDVALPSQGVVDSLKAAEAWLLPISETAPAGQDLTYSESTAALRAEMAKLESLSGERPNWSRVIEECDRLLRTESKDLTIATQLAQALCESSGLAGLELGLSLLAQLMDGYWESLFPPLNRVRRRANAVMAFIERVIPVLSGLDMRGIEPGAFERLDGAASMLQSTLERRFGADAPPVVPLLEALRSARQRASQSPASPAPAQITPSGGSTTSAPAPSAESRGAQLSPLPQVSSAPATGADALAFFEKTSTSLVQAAAIMRQADPASSVAARMARVGLWLDLLDPPLAEANGKTRIPPPDPRVRQWLPEFVAAGNWVPVLEQTEGMLIQVPFWLDLHFYAAKAYQGLGGAFAAAADGVLFETQKLVQRMPQLTELRFSDDTPFAAPDTLAWLSPPTAAPSGGEAETGAALSPEVLLGLLRGEAEHVASFEAALSACAGDKHAFLLRLEVAEAMLRLGKLEEATYLCIGLKREVDQYHLDRWDPKLALRVIETLCSAIERQGTPNGVVHSEWLDARARLGRLRPSALLIA